MTGDRIRARQGTARERVSRARLEAPRLPASHIRRARLLRGLDDARPGQVVLISAPAGFGKSTLLADWVGGHRTCTAWVSVSAEDNEDRHFWSALLGALGACPSVPGTSALHSLTVPAAPSSDADFVATVADALAALQVPTILVLDDIHELTAGAPMHGLTTLVRHRPAALRIVLSGRVDPLLPIARLRVQGQLCEIRAEQLRFTSEETAALLATTDLNGRALAPGLVAYLTEQTGGWAAGLRLAAPALQTADDPGRFLDDLVGSEHLLSDYLVDEVLDGLAPPDRELLEAVSTCERVTAPLAAAVAGTPDAGDLLDRLERDTGLVVSSGVGRVQYTVQPLLRAHLRLDLLRRRPQDVAAFHGRAATWFAEQGRPALALGHARQAGDSRQLADLLRRDGVRLMAEGEHRALREALALLEKDPGTSDPCLSLLAAFAHLEVGDLVEADRRLRYAEAGWPVEPTAELVALRDLTRSRRASLLLDPDGTESDLLAAEERLGITPLALVERGYVALGTQRPDAARDLAEAALERAAGHVYLTAQCHVLLAGVAAEQDDFPRMAALADRADAGLDAAGEEASRAAAVTAVFRSYYALLHCRPAECLERTRPAQAFIGALGADAPGELTTVIGAIRGSALVDGGDHAAGLDALRAARLAIAATSARTVALAALLETRAATTLGFTDRARAALAWATGTFGDSTDRADEGAGDLAFLRAHHQFQLGRGAAAASLLAPLLDGSAATFVRWVVPEGWVLACRLALRADQRAAAREALERAVESAAGMGVLRPLVFAAPEVVELMHGPGRAGPVGFVQRVLETRAAIGTGLPVALTARERTVLGLLMTQRSVAEIATDLTVSANTVKTHVRAIYTKLGVRNRREAITAVRERRLSRSPN